MIPVALAGTSNVLHCALRVSDDGFATCDEVSLDWTSHVGRGTGDNQGILTPPI